MTNDKLPNNPAEPETEIEELFQKCYQKEQMVVLDESGGPLTTLPVHDEGHDQ